MSSSDQASQQAHDLSICEIIKLSDSILAHNSAQVAGGAIFTSRAQNIRVDCPSNSEGMADMSAENRGRSKGRLDAIDDLCETWRSNSAGLYGHDVATFVSRVVTSVKVNEINVTVSNVTDPGRIGPYRSGSPLCIALKAVDDFDQAPAVGTDNHPVVSKISSPDHLFAGSNSILMEPYILEFTATGHARPGTYHIAFEFSEDSLERFEVEVEVQQCMIGEEPSEDRTSCEPCSAATYSFVLEEDSECLPCPENGNCTTQVILPRKGYWHKTPCSTHLQECLSSEACSFKEREIQLAAATENVSSCEFSDADIRSYTEVQCREVNNERTSGSLRQWMVFAGTRGTSVRIL